MSARSVCRGRRPSRYHSHRAISFPPRRPDNRTLIPLAPQFQVLIQQIGVLLSREPARPPGPVEPEPESVGMNLLSQSLTSQRALNPPVTFEPVYDLASSSTATWHRRLRIRKIRPIDPA